MLKTRRGQLKSQLTRFSTYVKGVNKDSVNPFEVKCRSRKIEELWSECDQVQSSIEQIGDETEEYCIEFQEIYFNAVTLGESLLQNVSTKNGITSDVNSTTIMPSSKINCSSNSCCSATTSIQLAAIDVPKFSGAYEEWSAF